MIYYLFRIFLKENGLDGVVPPDKASKKWENLKRKYKVRNTIPLHNL